VVWDGSGKKYCVVDDTIKVWYRNPVVKEFATKQEAENWFAENKGRLEQAYDDYQKQKREFVFFDTSRTRRGEDYRKGKDVTPERFSEQFGFRGVQFGNWTNGRDRQAALNEAYDAFMDLAKVLGISPKALSLNGELGLAFGARGSGDALAHYERNEVVINLTKTKGAGSLAHEWWHAMDNYFSRKDEMPMGFMTENTKSRSSRLRGEVVDAFAELMKAVDGSDFDKRSKRHSNSGYWGSTREETARLFAEWVVKELAKQGGENHFLSRGTDSGTYERYQMMRYLFSKRLKGDEKMTYEQWLETPEAQAGDYPFPFDDEIAKMFDKPLRELFEAMKVEKTEDGREVLYRMGEGQVAVARESSEMARMMRRAEREGVKVVGSIDEIGSEHKDVLEALTDGERVTGWYDGQSGEVWLYAPNIRSVDELLRTLRHEGVGHGLRELIGRDEFGRFCDKVWADVMDGAARREYVAYVNRMTVEQLDAMEPTEQAKLYGDERVQRNAADEFMAFMGEDGSYDKVGAWERLTQWVKGLLRKLGLNLRVTKADVMELLRRRQKAMRWSADGLMGADDDAMRMSRDKKA
jgi:hypothetical protein